MKFPDYISILKRHFKKSISAEELCRILFDAIIGPANLTDSHGEMLYIDKTEISRIMNCKKNVPVQLQDHVYDDAVLAEMNEYFRQNIVSELVPDLSDLFHQMFQLIDADPDISPAHRASLRMQASNQTVALFLADLFVYVVRQENKAPSKEVKPSPVNGAAGPNGDTPQIALCGIAVDGEISNSVVMAPCKVRDKYSVDEYQEKIKGIFEQVSSMHCEREESSTNQALIQLWGLSGVIDAMLPYKVISEQNKNLLREYAEEQGIEISDHFFSLGNLRIMDTFAVGKVEYKGSPTEIEKCELLESLVDYIERYYKLKRVDRAFEDVLFIRLAVQNTGKAMAEDMRIRLKFEANAFFDAEDMAYIDDDTLRLIFDKYSCDTFFEIERTANYLSYYSSTRTAPSINYPKIPFIIEKRDFAEEWMDYLPYYIERKGDEILLDLRMDKILHHTSVAFPTVLLFKHYTPSIEYSIFCRQMPDVLTGTLKITQA